MGPLWIAVSCVAAAFLGLLLGYVVARAFDRFRLQSAVRQAEDVARRARDEADKLRLAAELKARDELYQKREELNHEIDRLRNEVREQERRVSKREDGLEEKLDALQKRERVHEGDLRKFKERKTEVDKRALEIDGLIKQQAQKLQDLSGLTREQAEKLLLERLERELSDEIGSRLAAARGEHPPGQRGESRAASWPPPSSATPPSTPPTPPSARSTFPATT